MSTREDKRKFVSELDGDLSPRQHEVLQLLAKGLTNKEIGGVLGISGETVRTHITAVLAQLGVTNRTEAAAAYLAWEARADRVATLLKRPAIAVLPLVVLDSDPRATTSAAGIALDLVALFSRWCCFPVIANAATRSARSLGDTSQEIAQRLGALFLVDGTLRAARSCLRITVCVIDARSGYCLWADSYDFPREELFQVQDAVCQSIVAAAYPRLITSVHTGLSRSRHPSDLEAWELAHEALMHHACREREANARAQAGFGAALARDPALILAHFGLGLASYDEVLNQWGAPRPALDRLAACAERCIELGPHMAEGHYLSGRHLQARGDHDRAAESLQEAIGHNPSFASAHALLAQVLLLTGHADEGLSRMKQACRLDPRSFVAGLSVAHFARLEYAEALEAAERAIATNPRYPFARALAAASAWWLGEAEAAGDHARALSAIQPSFGPRCFLQTFGSDVDAVSRIAEALEAIGARSRLRGSS